MATLISDSLIEFVGFRPFRSRIGRTYKRDVALERRGRLPVDLPHHRSSQFRAFPVTSKILTCFLRRAALYPAELRVRWSLNSRTRPVRQRRRRDGASLGILRKAPKAEVRGSNSSRVRQISRGPRSGGPVVCRKCAGGINLLALRIALARIIYDAWLVEPHVAQLRGT